MQGNGSDCVRIYSIHTYPISVQLATDKLDQSNRTRVCQRPAFLLHRQPPAAATTRALKTVQMLFEVPFKVSLRYATSYATR